MEITVEKDMKVENLAKIFSEKYPFLKIAIYYEGEEVHFDSFHTLGNLSSIKKPESFILLPTMTTEKIEQLFWDKMGLQVAVFRKIGNTWVSTAFTNNLTLERQNQIAESIYRSSK